MTTPKTFQLTAARRRLGSPKTNARWMPKFQLTAARRRLENKVSRAYRISGFNSQPPEGGWAILFHLIGQSLSFNSQPPEGGWQAIKDCGCSGSLVSTHSRPKAAGCRAVAAHKLMRVSTHSRPKAAGSRAHTSAPRAKVFQLTAAQRRLGRRHSGNIAGSRFNSQPPEGGWATPSAALLPSTKFQLTAARRRLASIWAPCHRGIFVSTHSRPKAAGV